MSDLYHTDLVAWAKLQSEAVRQRALDQIDWDHVAAEIEELAARPMRQIRVQLTTICSLILRYESGERSDAWRDALVDARREISDLIEESPSLKAYLVEVLPAQLEKARRQVGWSGDAMWETGALYRVLEWWPEAVVA